MRSYHFDPTEFAKLEYLLGKIHGFLRFERSEAELAEFRAHIFPVLRDVNYKVLLPKIDDSQLEAISDAELDPWSNEVSADQAIDLLKKIFES